MANQFSVSGTIVYTPPLAAPNSGAASLSTQGVYNAQNVGSVDVPAGTTTATSFSVPFGSVGAASVVIVRNQMSTPINVRLNGSGTDTFELAPGAMFRYESPTTPATTPITAVECITTAEPTAIENIFYWIFGD